MAPRSGCFALGTCPGEFDTMASVPEAKEGDVIEAAEESPGECIFIEV